MSTEPGSADTAEVAQAQRARFDVNGTVFVLRQSYPTTLQFRTAESTQDIFAYNTNFDIGYKNKIHDFIGNTSITKTTTGFQISHRRCPFVEPALEQHIHNIVAGCTSYLAAASAFVDIARNLTPADVHEIGVSIVESLTASGVRVPLKMRLAEAGLTGIGGFGDGR